jgi:hypothetical protein
VIPDANIHLDPAGEPSRFGDIVSLIVEDVQRGHYIKEHTEALKSYGPLATPRLIELLAQADDARKQIILYALQHGWTDQARQHVADLLKHDSEPLRNMAAMLLAKNCGMLALAHECEPLIDDSQPAVAAWALEHAECERPDLERMRSCIERPELWDALWKYLPRYYAPELTPATLRISREGSHEAALGAIVSLIHQNARSDETRQSVAELLRHETPHVRDLAAEYLTWHGAPAQLAAIDAALAAETETWAAASLRAAREAILRRDSRTSAPLQAEPTGGRGDGGTGGKGEAETFAAYAHAEPFEPHFAYRGQNPPQEFIEQRCARMKLQARLFGVPTDLFSPNCEHSGSFNAPQATRFVPPLRHFFDPTRTSYGRDMEDSPDGFGGMFHVGDDVQWNRDHRTVVSIADGMVRQVSCTPTWGCLVAIEHVTGAEAGATGGEFFCSLYAHLSPFVCVVPGQIVTAGQKIGAIGRSFTWENGGYAAHVHFAIHKGPYWQTPRPGSILDVRWQGTRYRGKVLQSDAKQTVLEIHTAKGPYAVWKPSTWICGYVSKQTWEQDEHGWVEPQRFLSAPVSGGVVEW